MNAPIFCPREGGHRSCRAFGVRPCPGSIGMLGLVILVAIVVASPIPTRAVSAPIILEHPSSITAAYGDSVTLKVNAIGPDLHYRWEKLTTLTQISPLITIVSQRESLAFDPLKPEHAGRYRVVVESPGYGSATSREFTISFPADQGTDRLRPIHTPAPVRAGLPAGRGVVLNGRFYYPGYDPDGGVELWVTDGTGPGTRRVKDIQPGSANGLVTPSGNREGIGVLRDRLYFVADDGENGRALWISDGSEAGTRLLQRTFLFVPPYEDGPFANYGLSFRDVFQHPEPLNAAADLEATGFLEAGGVLFFQTTSSGLAGLGRTDGTEAGTGNLIAHELAPFDDSTPLEIPLLDVRGLTRGPAGSVYFVADTPDYGRELWTSDGTDAGTHLIRDIGRSSEFPDGLLTASLTPHAGRVYFLARTSSLGAEPWVSDGTWSGTFPLADIHPEEASSLPFAFTPFQDRVCFSAQSATGYGLWITDGTEAGTTLVREFSGGVSNLRAAAALIGGSRLYFSARHADTGFELWTSDGTPAGTAMVRDLVPGAGSSSPQPLGTDQRALYFANQSPETTRALWYTTGDDASTVRLTPEGPYSSYALLRVGDDSYFATHQSQSGRLLRLFRTTGTPASTLELAALPFAQEPDFQWANLGSRRILNTAGKTHPTLRTGELVVTDGTPAGTGLVDLPQLSGAIGGLTAFDGGLIFAAMTAPGTAGLFRTDGTQSRLLRTFDADSALGRGTAGSRRAIFAPQSGGWQQAGLLTTDGTAEGTRAWPLTIHAADLAGAVALGDGFVLAAGTTGFEDYDNDSLPPSWRPPVRNEELFRISASGQPSLLREIWPGPQHGSHPELFAVLGPAAYFFATDGTGKAGLWRTDGTPAGTTLVEAVTADAWYHQFPPAAFRPVAFGNRLYFGGRSDTLPLGTELWRTAGTPVSTVHFRDIYPGVHFNGPSSLIPEAGSGLPAEFTPVGGSLFFAATSRNGRELWKSDGTSAGTVQVKDFRGGDEEVVDPQMSTILSLFGAQGAGASPLPASQAARNHSNPTNLVAVAGRLYLVARDAEGTKLFRSDGTDAGTVPIESVRTQFGRPRELTSLNNRLYYVRGLLGARPQVWEYDPARDEHRAITALAGGVAQPGQLTASAGRLYFVGDDGHGQKLFVYERIPFIKVHPASQTLLADTSASLTVTPSVPDLAHVWRRGPGLGTPVGSEPTLTIPAADATPQPYSVRVTRPGAGSQTSEPAYLQVLDAVTSQRIQESPDRWWTLPSPPPEPGIEGSPGTLDRSWGVSNRVNGSVAKLIPLQDGKILVVGTFSEIAGKPAPNLARLLHDGALDPTFDPGAGPVGGVADAAVLPDGRILLVGGFLTVDGYQRERVARLLPDGSVDLDFKPALEQSSVQQVLAVLPAADGRLYVGGVFESWDGHPTVSVARLLPNGAVDTTFTVRNQPNTGGPFRVAALAFHPAPNSGPYLLVGGGTYFVEPGNGFTNQRRHVARLAADTGAWDPAFNLAPIPTPPGTIDGAVSQIAVLPDGKILAGGVQGAGHADFDGMVRLLPAGPLDPTFRSGPSTSSAGPSLAAAPFRTFAILASGRIVAGGRFTQIQGVDRSNLVQLLPNGTLDPDFLPAGGPNNEVTAVTALPDGGILVAGSFTSIDGVARRGLARLHGAPTPPRFASPGNLPILELGPTNQASLQVRVSGSPAPTVTWYQNGVVVGTGPRLPLDQGNPAHPGDYSAMIENPSGTILSSSIHVELEHGPPVVTHAPADARCTPGGTAVLKVAASGAPPLAFQWKRNGVPIDAATFPELRLAAVRLDAALDTYTVVVSNRWGRFETSPVRVAATLEGTRDPCFYEYTLPAGLNDGFLQCAPPTAFDFPSYRGVEAIAWQSSGHLILAGTGFTGGSQWAPATPAHLVRLSEAGQRAPIQGGHPDARVRAVATGPDDAVYIAGDFQSFVDDSGRRLHARRALAKYDARMAFVPDFAPALLPSSAEVTALLVQPDGKLLISGTFSNVNGHASLGIARLLPDGSNDPAFQSGLVYLHYARPLALALQADGRILLGGQGAYYGNGAPPRGEFRNQLCRLLANGAWDPTFETAGGAANAGYVENLSRIVVQPDQRILVAGTIARWGATPRNGIARLHPDGRLDASFDPGAGPDGRVSTLGLLPDGRVYVAGAFQKFNDIAAPNLVRLDPDGTVDEGFRAPPTDQVRDLLVRPGGRLYLAGSLGFGPFTPRFGPPRTASRPWSHPITGTIRDVMTYTFDSECPGHESEQGPLPGSGELCGTAYAWMNGIVRLRGTETPVSAPRILTQPQGTLRLAENASHTLFVGVEAEIPEGQELSYQWSKDGTEIPGATRAALRLDAVNRTTAGAYSVRVWNSLGAVVSDPAVVHVLPAATPLGRVSVDPTLRRFEWQLDPKPGQRFSTQDAAQVVLEVSDDLRTWVQVPGGVSLLDGSLVFKEDQAAFQARRFYRVVTTGHAAPAAAQLDPAASVELAAVPAPVRTLALLHLTAFIGDPRSRTADERDWENVRLGDQARYVFDPAHRDGTEPAYVEFQVISAADPADARGYVLVSLTEDDFPVVEFATRGPTKTERLLRRAGTGTVARFVRYGAAFLAAENAAGQLRASLGTAPLRRVGEWPDEGTLRTARVDTEAGVHATPPRSLAPLVPFGSYAELRDDFRSNAMHQAARLLRRTEAASRNRTGTPVLPILRLPAESAQTVLNDIVFASARLEIDDDESPIARVEVLREGGVRLTAIQTGSTLLRLRRPDGRVERRTVLVSPPGASGPVVHAGNCGYIREENWYAGTGWHEDQRQFEQLDRSSWCPNVGCGPTALAMLFGWWDVNGVPSAFYRLKSGQGSLSTFRFDFTSLATDDAPKTISTTAETELVGDVYNDLHGLCNVICSPFGDSGATMPDQMESAFYEYLARVWTVPLFPPMNEFGQGFVGVQADISYVPPGGMTDWEGGGKFVAQGIREGRPGIVGIGLCLCDPPHYALAYGLKRLTGYAGCGSDKHVVERRHFFKLNMGHGPGEGPEWHVAEDVWFGLSAHLWQKATPSFGLPGNTGEVLANALGLSAKREVSRPAAAMTPAGQRLVLIEGDNHGNVPTGFNRLRSLDGGQTFTTPLVGGIAGGVFRSGPAAVVNPNGQQVQVFGIGTDQHLWRARSTDGGSTWPGGWSPLPLVAIYQSAPAAAAASFGSDVYVVALAINDTYHLLASRDGGQTWPLYGIGLAGSFKSAPAVATSADGRAVHVVGLGTDNHFWHAYSFNHGTNWAGWWPVGEGVFVSAPAVALSASGDIVRVFGRGTDNQYWQNTSVDDTVSWFGWSPIVPGAVFSSGPAVVMQPDGQHIQVFGRGLPPVVPEGTIPDPSRPRIYRAVSGDGGGNWPGGFSEVIPSIE